MTKRIQHVVIDINRDASLAGLWNHCPALALFEIIFLSHKISPRCDVVIRQNAQFLHAKVTIFLVYAAGKRIIFEFFLTDLTVASSGLLRNEVSDSNHR